MNRFETRINALRLQYKAERVQIQKDSSRAIGHGTTAEAREALRAEKVRRALAIIAAHADGAGLTSLSVPFGDNRIGRVTFE